MVAVTGLQFGHGLGAVENSRLSKTKAGWVWLQFGHGLGAVENMAKEKSRSAERPGFNSATASGPWRTSLGAKWDAAKRQCFNSATASGPWRTRIEALTRTANARLQFGHGLGAVENHIHFP